MRFLGVGFVALVALACKSDPPGYTPQPTPAPSTAAPNALDVTPLPGAPAFPGLGGWWIVEASFKPATAEPGNQPGHAWRLAPDALRLVFGDAVDQRVVTATKVEGDALRLEVEGADLLVTRRARGIAVRVEDGEAPIPLRRATAAEVAAIDAADKRRQKMLDRACTKAYECCVAARGKGVAKENDCAPLLGPPDLAMCIQAITVFKNKAATAKVVIPECLPDK